MEYYSALKRNKIESIVVRWMKLETVIQSEVSQIEEKKVSYIITYIWNLEKWYWQAQLQGRNGNRNIENGFWTQQGKEKMGRIESIALKHTHYYV